MVENKTNTWDCKLLFLFKMYVQQIEKELNINITMIGIDECLYENNKCEGSCTNRLEIGKQPYLVNANMTSLVGVHLSIITDCVCEAHNQSHVVHCHYSSCYNRGQCVQENSGVRYLFHSHI